MSGQSHCLGAYCDVLGVEHVVRVWVGVRPGVIEVQDIDAVSGPETIYRCRSLDQARRAGGAYLVSMRSFIERALEDLVGLPTSPRGRGPEGRIDAAGEGGRRPRIERSSGPVSSPIVKPPDDLVSFWPVVGGVLFLCAGLGALWLMAWALSFLVSGAPS